MGNKILERQGRGLDVWSHEGRTVGCLMSRWWCACVLRGFYVLEVPSKICIDKML